MSKATSGFTPHIAALMRATLAKVAILPSQTHIKMINRLLKRGTLL